MPSPLQHIQGLIKAVGVVSALNILARRTAGLARPTAVRLRDASRDKVMVRPTQSDLFAAAQVFGWEDYQLSRSVIERLNDVAKSSSPMAAATSVMRLSTLPIGFLKR